jgi:hypothetical protein
MSNLAKTRKRPVMDISGGFIGLMSDRADNFMKFLSTNSNDAFTRPWHRLERGMRLNRLRKFTEDEAERFQFSEEDKVAMFQVLIKCLDKKQLNSKSIVTYDHEEGKILEIKGLTFHKAADGRIVFQFSEKRTGTLRRKAAVAVATSDTASSSTSLQQA